MIAENKPRRNLISPY